MRYFALIGEGLPVTRPLALLRCSRPGLLESYGRDGRWYPDPRVELLAGKSDRDLAEVTAGQAGRLQVLWRPEADP